MYIRAQELRFMVLSSINSTCENSCYSARTEQKYLLKNVCLAVLRKIIFFHEVLPMPSSAVYVIWVEVIFKR